MSKLTIIAGPCVIESEENVMYIARRLKKIMDSLDIEFYFKASFDKANRTSIDSLLASGRNDHSESGEINQFQPLENSQCTSATPFLS